LAVWDYCSGSARLLFDTAPIDPTARRISQALDVTPEGLSRVQIRALFHRHVSKERIDLALEQLFTLGLINSETAAGRGRSATLWAKVQNAATGTGTRNPTHKAHRALTAHIPPRRRKLSPETWTLIRPFLRAAL
jgi:hypothetical protein